MSKVIITAGGTGGHIFPALAVARELKAKGLEVHWIGSRGGLEERLVTEFPFSSISIKGLRGKSFSAWFWAPWRLIQSTWQAWKAIRRIQPQLVIGLGGFVTGPTGLAAWLARVPLLIHEQNAIAGYTNRLLSKIASLTLQAFPHTFSEKTQVITVGNPVRPEIIALPTPEARLAGRTGPLRILVLGGSLGAHFLNQMLLEAMPLLMPTPFLWQQSGREAEQSLIEHYAALKIEVKVSAFIEDMAQAYAWADLVIARAGALTVAELAAAGVASILIPYPHAVDNHQFYNGHYLASVGAAVVIPQNAFRLNEFLELLEGYQKERESLLKMAKAARQQAWPHSSAEVVQHCLGIIHCVK